MTHDDVLQTLLIRTEEIRDAVTALEAQLKERCPGHTRRIERLETILDGSPANGQNPGLLGRVGVIEDAIKRLDRAKSWAFGVTGAIIGGSVVAVVEKLL